MFVLKKCRDDFMAIMKHMNLQWPHFRTGCLIFVMH